MLFSAFSLVQLISVFNLPKEEEFEDGLCEMLQLFFLRNNSQKNPPPPSPQLWHQTYINASPLGLFYRPVRGSYPGRGGGGRRDTGVRVSVCKCSMCLCLVSGLYASVRVCKRVGRGGVWVRDGGLDGG